MLKDEIEKKILTLKKIYLDESPKLRIIFSICNPWKPRFGFNQEAQFSTNLLLKDEIEKNISI